MKSGTSNNPTCEKINNMLYQRLGLVWVEACNVLNTEISKITDEAYPIKGRPRYIDIMKQAKEAWPHVVNYLVDNMGKVFQDARKKLKLMKKNINHVVIQMNTSGEKTLKVN